KGCDIDADWQKFKKDKSYDNYMRAHRVKVGKMEAVSPPGWGGTVKHMADKHKGISNPHALAWYMYEKGDSSHKKAPKGTGAKHVSEKTAKKRSKALKMKSAYPQIGGLRAGGPGSGRHPEGGFVSHPPFKGPTRIGRSDVHPRNEYNEHANKEVRDYLQRNGFKSTGANDDPHKEVVYSKHSEHSNPGEDDTFSGSETHSVIVYPNGEWEHSSESSHSGSGLSTLSALRFGNGKSSWTGRDIKSSKKKMHGGPLTPTTTTKLPDDVMEESTQEASKASKRKR